MRVKTNTFITLLIIELFFMAITQQAQTTAFSYQGKLTDAGSPANANYQMQFKLFDAANGGNQIGVTISDIAITAAQGVFTTRLDFGASAFSGADRFLEVAVRKNSNEAYTIINPRQQISSSPYSIRTLSAQQADVALDSQKLGGINASEYVTNATLNTNFIRNQTMPQASSNFNISGSGTTGGSLTIGDAYYGMKKLKEATEAYSQAVKIDPNLSEAHFGLALAYRAAGKKTEALNEYRILQQIAPKLADQYLLIATEKK